MKTYYASADQDEGYSYGNYDHIRTPGGDDMPSSKPQQFSFSQPPQNFQSDMAPLYSNQQAPQIGHGYSDPNNDESRASRITAQKFGSYFYGDNSSGPKPEDQTKSPYVEPVNKEDIQRLIAGNSPINPYHVSNPERMYEPGYSEPIPRNEKPQNHYMNVTPYNAHNANQAQTAYQISPAVNEDSYTYGQQYSPELNKSNQQFFNDPQANASNTKKFTIPITSLQNLNHNQLIANISAQQGYNPQSVLTPESVHAQQYVPVNRSQDIGARPQVLVDHSEGYNPQSVLTPESVHVQQFANQSQNVGGNALIFVDNSAEAKKSYRRPSEQALLVENQHNHTQNNNNQNQSPNQNYVQPPRKEVHAEVKEEKQFEAVENQVLEDTLEYHDFSDDDDDVRDTVGAYYQDLADQPLQEADRTGKVANTPNKGLREEFNMSINGSSIRVYSQGSESQRQNTKPVEPEPQQVNPPHVVGQAAWSQLQNVDKGNRNNVSPLQMSQQKNSTANNNGNSHRSQANQDEDGEEMERIRRELAQAEERLEGLINQNLQKLDKGNDGHKKVSVSATPEETRTGDEIPVNKQNHTRLVPGELWVLDVPDSHRKEDITAKVPKKASKVLTRLNKVNLIAYLFDKADHQQ